VLLTADEYRAMAAGLADTNGPATAPTTLSGWIAEQAAELGLYYANELDRHHRASPPTPPVRAAPGRSAPAGRSRGEDVIVSTESGVRADRPTRVLLGTAALWSVGL
jgi:SRSO17 transposase